MPTPEPTIENPWVENRPQTITEGWYRKPGLLDPQRLTNAGQMELETNASAGWAGIGLAVICSVIAGVTAGATFFLLSVS